MPHVMLAPHNSNSSPTAWEHVHRNTIDNLFSLPTIGLGSTALGLCALQAAATVAALRTGMSARPV